MYCVEFTIRATKDVLKFKKFEPQAYKKFKALILELGEHPETGTGHPKPLSGDMVGKWSRRITDKHRLIYKIQNETIAVLVLSAYGHYEDK
ncbi:MAG: Txe/YoeB family addiction module toxin [Prevotellaceae bacterium]|jgi:toxin YoeB|nr:Txe/YoeB family addiction module toxin [Prevotellaceae bacterium]